MSKKAKITIAVAAAVLIAAGGTVFGVVRYNTNVNSKPGTVQTASEQTAAPLQAAATASDAAAETPPEQAPDTVTAPEKTSIPELTPNPTLEPIDLDAIAAAAAASTVVSGGGSNVESYEKKNEKEMKEYMKEQVPVEEQRIIATSAATCDIMDRLGIDLIGVPQTTVSVIAARYKDAARVGSPMEPDMEIIKKLSPTDVIGPDTLQADLQMKYDNIGVHSTFLNLRSVEGLYDSVKAVGYRYGKQAEADAIVAEYKEFMANYSSGHSGKKPRVLVLMGLPGSYLVATQNSYAGSLVELAGGENVFHHDSKDFISVNTEELYARDPDVIIRTAHGLPEEALKMFDREFTDNDIWKHFRAVKEGRVYDVDYMLFGMSATFDYPQALADLEPMLFGDGE